MFKPCHDTIVKWKIRYHWWMAGIDKINIVKNGTVWVVGVAQLVLNKRKCEWSITSMLTPGIALAGLQISNHSHNHCDQAICCVIMPTSELEDLPCKKLKFPIPVQQRIKCEVCGFTFKYTYLYELALMTYLARICFQVSTRAARRYYSDLVGLGARIRAEQQDLNEAAGVMALLNTVIR